MVTVISHQGRRTLRKIGSRLYRRLDGKETTLTIWETTYIQCGAVFKDCRTRPREARGKNGQFSVTTCPIQSSTARTIIGNPRVHHGC